MDWHTNFMPLPKQLHPNESKKLIGNLNDGDSAEVNHFSHDDSFT